MDHVSAPKVRAHLQRDGRSTIDPATWLDGTTPHLQRQAQRDQELGRDPDAGLTPGSAEWVDHYMRTINPDGVPVPGWFEEVPPTLAPYIATFRALAAANAAPVPPPPSVAAVIRHWIPPPGWLPLPPATQQLAIIKLLQAALSPDTRTNAVSAIFDLTAAEADGTGNLKRAARAASVHLEKAGIEIRPEHPVLPDGFAPTPAELESLIAQANLPFADPLPFATIPTTPQVRLDRTDRHPWLEVKLDSFFEAAAGTGTSGAMLVHGGLTCKGFAEIDDRKAGIAAANLQCRTRITDLTKTDPSRIPGHDVLYGGLNCAPFSTIGKRRGLRDSRATVFWHFLLTAAVKKPKVCVIENVANFVTLHGGKDFAAFTGAAKLVGYRVEHTTRNASAYAPQDRARCFVFLVREDIAATAGMPDVPPPISSKLEVADWLSDPDLVPHTWVDTDTVGYTPLRDQTLPVSDAEAGKPVLVGYVGATMSLSSRVFMGMVPAIKTNGNGHGGNTHLVRQFSAEQCKWVVRTLDVREVVLLHAPHTCVGVRPFIYDPSPALTIADIGSACPADLVWAQVLAIRNFGRPTSKWRPHGATFEDIGLTPKVLTGYRNSMRCGFTDMTAQVACGDATTEKTTRPNPNTRHRPTMKDANGVFPRALPAGPAASADPTRTNVTYVMEDAFKANDPSLIYPVQEYHVPRTKFVPAFIRDVAARGFRDVNIVSAFVNGTDQGNNVNDNISFLPANAKGGQQYWFHVNDSIEEDLTHSCAAAFGPHLCPPLWPISSHKTGSVEKGEVKEEYWIPGTPFKRRGTSDLANKGVHDAIKARGVRGANESVNTKTDLPALKYLTVMMIAQSMLLLSMSGVNPTMAALDLARYYKQWFTKPKAFGTHCRYWPSVFGPAVIVSMSMLFGGAACANIAHRGSCLVAFFVQTILDLIQPSNPRVRRWLDLQAWATRQRDGGDPRFATFMSFEHGGTIQLYLDDFALCALPGFEAHLHGVFMGFLWCAGLQPQCAKIMKDGNFDAFKKILGVNFNLTTRGIVELSLPDNKVVKANNLIDTAISAGTVPLKTIEELLGLLNWASMILVKAGSHLACLIAMLRVALRDGAAVVTPDALAQLQWWRALLHDWNGRSVVLDPVWTTDQLDVPSTDASRSTHDGGAGGIFHHWFFAFKWAAEERQDLDIMHLEALACVLWVAWICHRQPQLITGKRFRMWCDNQPWVATVNKGRSSWPALEFLGNILHSYMAQYSFLLELNFISTHDNIAADCASRFAWSEFYAHVKRTVNLDPAQLTQVDVRLEVVRSCSWILETRRLRCCSRSMPLRS